MQRIMKWTQCFSQLVTGRCKTSRKCSSKLSHSWPLSFPFSINHSLLPLLPFLPFHPSLSLALAISIADWKMYASLPFLLVISLVLSNNNNGIFFFFFQVDAAVQFELIHRHAPQLSNHAGKTLGPPKNSQERVKQLIHSDNARQQMISHRLGQRRKAFEFDSSSLINIPIRSAADTGTGQYFVSFRLGSPPQRFVLIADTGSDLTWIHCNYSCHVCSEGTGRIFHAHLSRSFKTIPCMSSICKVDLVQSFSLSHCPTPSTPCAYDYR